MPQYVSVSDYIRTSRKARRERQNTERSPEPAAAFTTEHLDEILTRRNTRELAPLVHSIFRQESSSGRADTSEANHAGARGPMQVTRGAFDQVKQAGLIPQDYQWENPQHSAEAGVAYVEHLRSAVGDDPERIARAYYGGPGAVDRPDRGDPRNPNAPTVGEYGQQVVAHMGGAQQQPQQPPRKWAEVATDPKFLALAPEKREAVRNKYFVEVVAPQIKTSDPGVMARYRAKFDADTKPSVLTQAADAAKALGAGAISGVSMGLEGIGEGMREGGQKVSDVLGLDVEAVNPIAATGAPQLLKDQSKALADTRSTGSKIAEATSTPTGDVTDPSTWSAGADPSVAGYMQHGANILGQLAPTLLTAYLTRGKSLGAQMATGAGVGASQAGGAGAQEAREFIAQIPEDQLTQQSSLYRELLDQGLPAEQARAQLADESAKWAFRGNALVGALGGAATGAVLSPALKVGGRLAAGSRAGQAALKGAAGAAEESAQEVAEGIATIAGVNEGAGMDRSLTEGSFQNAVLGAMGGGAPAAVAGALSPLQQSTQRLREATERARRGEAINAEDVLGGVEGDAQAAQPTAPLALPAPADFIAAADGTVRRRGEETPPTLALPAPRAGEGFEIDAQGNARRLTGAEEFSAEQARAEERARRRDLGMDELERMNQPRPQPPMLALPAPRAADAFVVDAEGSARQLNEGEAFALRQKRDNEATRRRDLGLHEIRPPEWVAFPPNTGTLGVPRAHMPQVKAEHRGALVNFLSARGITHEQQEVPAADLKATQAEYSPSKVDKAKKFTGGDRSILVSSDGHIVDGHHQWIAKLDAGESVKVIRLNAPIAALLPAVKEFPSSTADTKKAPAHGDPEDIANQRARQARSASQPTLPVETPPKPTVVNPRGRQPLDSRWLADTNLHPLLQEMAQGAGWAEVGGKMLRESNDFNDPGYNKIVGRTKWIPRQEWFGQVGTRLGKGHRTYPEVLADALAGKPLTARERLALEDMIPHAESILLDRAADDAELAEQLESEYQRALADISNEQQAGDEYRRMLEEEERAYEAEIDAFAGRDASGDSADGAAAESEPDSARQRGSNALTSASDAGGKANQGDSLPKGQAGTAQAQQDSALAADRRVAAEPFALATQSAPKKQPAAPQQQTADLFGTAPVAQQAIADAERAKDAKRNSGQQSVETGDPSDMFSQARQQTDIADAPAPVRERIKQMLDSAQDGLTEAEVLARLGVDARSSDADEALNALDEIADEGYAPDNEPGRGFVYLKGRVKRDEPEPSDQAIEKTAAPDAAERRVARKPAASRRTSKQSDRTADAGEELFANRRNQSATGLTWNDLQGLNATLRVKEATKAKIWPKPDYEQMVEDSVNPVVAYLVKTVYDAIATKPQVRGAPTDEQIKQYADGVGSVRAAIEAFMSKHASRRDAAEIAGAINVAELLDAVFPVPPGAKERFRDRSDEAKRNNALAILLGGNKLTHAMQITMRDVFDAGTEVAAGWPSPKEAWQRQGYTVLSKEQAKPRVHTQEQFDGRPPAHFIQFNTNGRISVRVENVAEGEQKIAALKDWLLFDKYGRVVDSADTQEAVAQIARDKVAKAQKKRSEPAGVDVDEAKRLGVDRREKGENISSEQLREAFGFKGINFGNWMQGDSNRVERQSHLNHAYDSFMDLADVLGVPPKALSLNGMLGLAFGAQGKGGAAAHFVPGVNEINLTRVAGAGSLAHEFGHALDHYFATQAGERYARSAASPFISAVRLDEGHGLRPEIAAAFRKVLVMMRERPQTAEEARKAREQYIETSRKYTKSWIDSMRRDAQREGRDFARFDALAERILAGDMGEGYKKSGNLELSAVVADIREEFKNLTGRLRDAESIKSLENNARSLKHALDRKTAADSHEPQRMLKTRFATDSGRKDGGKKEPYYSTPHEMFARAFESFVMDALTEKQARNDYLVNAVKAEAFADNELAYPDGYPYPRGEERKAINAAFKTLVGELKTRETERGTALYSRADEPATADTSSERVAAWLADKIAAVRGAANVHVVKDAAELAESTGEEPLHSDVRGLYYGGGNDVWLVASELSSREDAERVFRHEVEGHLAVELYGDLRGAIQAVLNGRDGGKLGELWREEAARDKNLSEETIAKEVIARIAEDGIKHPLMARLIAAVKDVLRKLGFDFGFDENDIRGMVAGAVRKMQRAAEGARAKALSNSDARPSFSRSPVSREGNARFAMQVLRALGGVDAFFKNPATRPATLRDAFRQIPGFDVPQNDTDRTERSGVQRNVTHFTRALPGGKKERVPVYIYQQGRKVWIDVSRLKRAEGGDLIYQAIADWARNTDRSFVGDPAGLSPDAVVRRTYHMLSNMVRYGDLKGFEPAKEQLEGNAANGIPPLEWTPSDAEKQFRSLIRTFYATIKAQYPGISRASYDFRTGRFNIPADVLAAIGRASGAAGAVLSGDGAASSRADAPGLGGLGADGATAEGSRYELPIRLRAVRAGIFLQSLAHVAGSERPGILAEVLRKPAVFVQSTGRLFSRGGPAAASRATDAAASGLGGQQQARRSTQRSGLIDALFKGVGKPFADAITSPLYDRLIRAGGAIIPEKVKQAVVSDYGLDEPYLDAKIDRQSAINKVLRDTRNVLDHLAGLTREQSRVAYLWMQEKPDSALEAKLLAALPADARAPVLRMKQLVDQLGRDAVRVGLLSEESYERNRMAYLHRTYRAHLAPGEKDTQAVRHKKNAQIRANNFKGRGLRDDVLSESLPDGVQKGDVLERQEQRDAQGRLRAKRYVKPGTALAPGWKSDGVWEARWTEGQNKIGMWRDMNEDERERLGEIEEVRYAFARTMMNAVADIETQKFFGWVADNYAKDAADLDADKIVEPGTGYASVKSYAADEYVKVPDVDIPKTAGLKKYGELSGKLIPAVIWNDIRVTYATPDSAVAQGYAKLLRAWKVSKTALSPAVHTNNIMSNFILADIADVRARDVAHALQTIYRAKHGDEGAKAIIARFEDSGGESGSFHAMELHSDMQELQNEQDEGLYGQLAAAQIVALLSAGRVKDAAKALGQKAGPKQILAAGRKMIDLYRAEDSVFRLAKFMRETESGKSDRDAGKAARDAFLNYDINAPLVQAARRSVLPFIAFSYRAIPKMIETAARKPWKLAKYVAAAKALNALAYSMLGLGGDDEDEERRLLPEEMQGRALGVFPRLIRMPWNGANDAPVFLDVRRWVPAGDIFDVAGSQAAVPLPPWLSIGGPVAYAIELATNRSGFTGENLVKETDTKGEAIGKLADHFFKFAAPNLPAPNPLNFVLPAGKDEDGPRFIDLGPPGVDRERLQTYAWTNILRAGTGRTDSMGRESGSLKRSILSSVGVKMRDYPKDVARRGARFELETAIREIDENIRSLKREAGRDGVNSEELQKRLQRERRKKERAVREYQEQAGA